MKTANRYGITPLSLACINGNAAMVGKLLRPAPTERRGQRRRDAPDDRRAFRQASKPRRSLEHGADVDARENWHGETALMWAAAQKHPAMMKELIAHGADVNAMSTILNWERQVTANPATSGSPVAASQL